MAQFMCFTDLNGKERIINLDHIRQIVPHPEIIGVCVLIIHAMIQQPTFEVMEVKTSFTDLQKKLTLNNLSIVH